MKIVQLNEPEKEIEKKVTTGVSVGLITNGVLLLALGVAIAVTKGRILKRFL